MPGYTAEVDPACAICAAPATHKCGCEADALEVAIAQAEERFIRPAYADVRCWVRARARDYILAYFHIISEPCKDAYSARIQRLLSSSSSSSHHHHHRHHHRRNHPPPSSSSSSSSAAALAAERYYRADIDRAWVLAVKHYPEVLDYFYSLVHVSLPDDRDPAVRDPPALDRLAELRRVPTRRGGGGGSSSDHRRRSAPQFPIPPLPAPPLQPPMAVPWPPPRQRPPPPPPPPPSTPLHPHLPPHPASFPPPPPGPSWTYPYPPH